MTGLRILVMANNDVGLYKFRKELLATLLDKGHEVYISLPWGELVKPLEELGCSFIDTPIDRRGINPVTDLMLFFRYLSMIRRVKPDQIITYTIKPNIYGALAARLLKVPYAVNITGLGTAFEKQGVLRKLVTGLYKLALKQASVVFFENEENMQLFIRERMISNKQAKRLNGAGVNLEDYEVKTYPDAPGTRFLFIGRIMAEKGVDELFSAMRRLVQDGEACSLDMLGGFDEDYMEQIRAAEQEGWLRYHGYQSDVRPFIEKSHCFVLPSWHEGMANTNLECAASGRPVITSDIPGCREAVEDGVSGFLCGAKDCGSLYLKMKEFCQLGQEERRAMGLAGRKRMELIFDKTVVVAETVSALNI